MARRVSDCHVSALIKMWLKTSVEEVDGAGRRRLTGGRRSKCGTPQGGVISPLLANLYMNRFLKYWRLTRMGEKLEACVVNYADDFVICKVPVNHDTASLSFIGSPKVAVFLLKSP